MLLCTVTATIGSPCLRNNLLSANRQLDAFRHLIIVDGSEYHARTRDILESVPPSDHVRRSVIWLPENTGKEYVCHRIVAASGFLVNEPYLTYLDEDNEMKDQYVTRILQCIADNPGVAWGFFLRDIVGTDSQFICHDSCESLGSISPTFFGSHADDRLVDTNCFVMTVATATKFAACWYVKAKQPGVLDGDRRVSQAILAHERGNHFIIRESLVNYRVPSQKGLFFTHGNEKIWKHTQFLRSAKHLVYVFHFNKQQTHAIFSSTTRSPIDEWCMTLLDDIIQDPEFCVLDGFKSNGIFAPGSFIVLNICHPDMLPCHEIRQRAAMYGCQVIANMSLESPNFRHQRQFDRDALDVYDGILTFWPHILNTFPKKAVHMPHNARFFTDHSQMTNHLVSTTASDPQLRRHQVSICLERRQFDATYVINAQVLHALDFMRERLVTGLRDVLVRGKGWDGVRDVHFFDNFQGPRHEDKVHPIDVYRRSTFALVVENCDCPGYVSEKVQDVFMAGTIPLIYNGGNDVSHILPDGTYLLINDITDGHELQVVLDSLSDDEVRVMQERISQTRVDYAVGRGSKAFTHALRACITLLQTEQVDVRPSALLPSS